MSHGLCVDLMPHCSWWSETYKYEACTSQASEVREELDLNSLSLSMSWKEEDEWWFCSVSPWQTSTLLVSDSSLPSRTLNNKLPPSSIRLSISYAHFPSPMSISEWVYVWTLSDLLCLFCYKYLAKNNTLAAPWGVKHMPAHTHTHIHIHCFSASTLLNTTELALVISLCTSG